MNILCTFVLIRYFHIILHRVCIGIKKIHFDQKPVTTMNMCIIWTIFKIHTFNFLCNNLKYLCILDSLFNRLNVKLKPATHVHTRIVWVEFFLGARQKIPIITQKIECVLTNCLKAKTNEVKNKTSKVTQRLQRVLLRLQNCHNFINGWQSHFQSTIQNCKWTLFNFESACIKCSCHSCLK